MLRISHLVVARVLPGWQASRRIEIVPPMEAVIVDEGVLILDGSREKSGPRHLLVPWSNIVVAAVEVEE